MLTEHWNRIFKRTPENKLGWYENDFSQMQKFIDLAGDIADKWVFLAGAGTSRLADHLAGQCRELILNDISSEALLITQHRLQNSRADIIWLNDDISKDIGIDDSSVDLWIDRAVLHFLTDERDIEAYFENMFKKLKPSAYAILAEFAENGAPKCAGLDLHRYSIEEIQERTSGRFNMIYFEDYIFINPDGAERPYHYSLLQKSDKRNK